VKGIQVCSNNGPGPRQRRDNHKNAKLGLGHIKMFSRTTVRILTKLGKNHPWGEGIQFYSNEGDRPSARGDNSERVKKKNTEIKKNLLQNHWAKFNQT
jgi:hypothetical protein